MNKFAAILLATATVISLPACGTRGPLILPPGPTPPPVLGYPTPAVPASVPDVSTDKKARPE